jgi:hypothetical protein
MVYIVKKGQNPQVVVLDVQESVDTLEEGLQKLRALPGCFLFDNWTDVTPEVPKKINVAGLAAKALKNLKVA